MRGSRKFSQRGSNFDNVFALVDVRREDPSTTINGPSSARQQNTIKCKFSQLCKWRVALKHILMVDLVGTKTSRIPKGQFVQNKDYQYWNQA